MLRFMLLLAIMVLAFLSGCSDDITGGTTDSGNAFALAGVVRTPDGVPVKDAAVSVKQVVINAAGDSLVASFKTYTDSSGKYLLTRLPRGNYLVYTEDSTGEKVGEVLNIVDPKESAAIEHNVTLHQPVTVKGRVISRSDENIAPIRVFIPGTNAHSGIDSSGVYTLRRVPPGQNIIAFATNSIVNYLPVSIDNNNNGTVYGKDVLLKSDTGTVVKNYQPYATTLSKSLAIVPREYKPESAPEWYEGKDFSLIEYFGVEGAEKTHYAPDPKQILYVGRYSNNDLKVVNRLEQNGYTVFLMRDYAVTEKDTTGMNLLYISTSADTATIQSLFKTAPIPLMTTQHDYPQRIDMAMVFEQPTNRTVLIADSTHVLAAGLSGVVTITTRVAYRVTYAEPSQGAHIIGVHPEKHNRSAIFAYDKGAAMLTIPAPAKRLGFLVGPQAFENMTDEGWLLYDTAIEWLIDP